MYEIFEKLCKDRGVTPYKVCKEIGEGTSMTSNWKAGRYTPKADKLQKIADYFGVSVEYLMTGKVSEKESISGKKYYFDDETAEAAQAMFENEELRVLFDAARNADPEDLTALYDMLLALKRKERRND